MQLEINTVSSVRMQSDCYIFFSCLGSNHGIGSKILDISEASDRYNSTKKINIYDHLQRSNNHSKQNRNVGLECGQNLVQALLFHLGQDILQKLHLASMSTSAYVGSLLIPSLSMILIESICKYP